jgi:protein-L-isoaspartate(D-aspartate) O-methyltransferase
MLTSYWRFAVLLAVVGLVSVGSAARSDDDIEFSEQRARMIEIIEAYARRTSFVLEAERLDPRVVGVMARTPRHLFVLESQRHNAYADRPLRIGYGQTISQPFIVALMTHLLAPEPGDVVLEVGTGSGYQAAVLAPLVARVCTIEIIPELGQSAAKRLEELGYANVRARVGDGYYGWEECGPFDAIVVTAAADHVPPPLIRQLKPDGRMVIPVGGPFVMQHLVLVLKGADGRVRTRQLLPVAFVPLTREAK